MLKSLYDLGLITKNQNITDFDWNSILNVTYFSNVEEGECKNVFPTLTDWRLHEWTPLLMTLNLTFENPLYVSSGF